MNPREIAWMPTPETQHKLLLSQQEAEGLAEHDLSCPVCAFKMGTVYEDRAGHIRLKCPKCKRVSLMNLAYFRRQRIYRLTITADRPDTLKN